jgi:hypothetical protein
MPQNHLLPPGVGTSTKISTCKTNIFGLDLRNKICAIGLPFAQERQINVYLGISLCLQSIASRCKIHIVTETVISERSEQGAATQHA